MGAKIRIRENGCICIEGVEKLEAGDDCIPPDRIVAGTYLMAAAATRGEIILENPPLEEMDGILDVYRKMGGQCHRVGGKLIVNGKNTGFPLELLETEVYPGFPTDLQSPAMAVLATIPGVSRIREKIFEDRYKTASWLCKMGAQIQIRDGVAVIYGGAAPDRLYCGSRGTSRWCGTCDRSTCRAGDYQDPGLLFHRKRL